MLLWCRRGQAVASINLNDVIVDERTGERLRERCHGTILLLSGDIEQLSLVFNIYLATEAVISLSHALVRTRSHTQVTLSFEPLRTILAKIRAHGSHAATMSGSEIHIFFLEKVDLVISEIKTSASGLTQSPESKEEQLPVEHKSRRKVRTYVSTARSHLHFRNK